jgi:hypothetical protein
VVILNPEIDENIDQGCQYIIQERELCLKKNVVTSIGNYYRCKRK